MKSGAEQHFVDIEFDCLPLRSIGRMDIPMDASPKFRARCERIKQLMDAHGTHNTYYLHHARCRFHLTNDAEYGVVEFTFDGVVITDESDQKTHDAVLRAELSRETCDWLTEPVVEWFRGAVSHAVQCEFDRYIAAGDLAQTKERIAAMQASSDQQGGFLGMYL